MVYTVPAAKHCWIFCRCGCSRCGGRCSCCGRRSCSRRRFGWRVDSRVVVDPVDVVADAGVETGHPGTLAIDGRISNPGHSDDGVRLGQRVVIVHRPAVVALSFYQKRFHFTVLQIIGCFYYKYVAESATGGSIAADDLVAGK